VFNPLISVELAKLYEELKQLRAEVEAAEKASRSGCVMAEKIADGRRATCVELATEQPHAPSSAVRRRPPAPPVTL